MLATAPQPPHLLPHPKSHLDLSTIFPSSSRAPTTTMGKTIMGLFSRSRSPDSNEQTGRSRLRTVIGEKRARPVTSGGALSGTKATTREPVEKRLRPPTPDFGAGHTKRNIRFVASAVPAIQKGEDGRWQPPSLSRGSVSTSALALYAQGEDMDMEVEVRADARGRRGVQDIMDWGKEDRAIDGLGRRGNENLRPGGLSSEKSSPGRSVHPSQSSPSGVRIGTAANQTSKAPSHPSPAPSTRTTSLIPITPGPSVPSPTKTTTRGRAPTAPSVARSPYPPTTAHPTHTRAISEPLLSKDHFAIRLSTSYLLKCLTPIIRGSSFVQNDKNTEMRRMADERLGQLERMERGWGGEWGKIAAGAMEEASEGLESRVRAVQVGEMTRERERKVWKDAIKDGVLLCLLFNHLFPAQPAHIPRVNISEDGILRATNITRVITACQATTLSSEEIFGLSDLQDGSEGGLGRVAGTILALARTSARSPGRAKSPSQAASRNTGRAPSRATSPSPAMSPPGTPRRSVEQSRRGSHDPSRPEQRNSTAANDLHSKLQEVLSPSVPKTVANLTPPSSGFVQPQITPTRLAHIGRSITQPEISPLRPKSPTTPTRPSTPINHRSSQMSTRPVLRPRNTTGTRTQVSFIGDSHSPKSRRLGADQYPGPQAPSAHSRERTPSLISSGSRVTSGYTRSSAAFSINTVIGDESQSVDVEDEDGSLRRRGHWERRASEKTLHNARQKILGTLLSSEDLPADLQVAIAAGHLRPYPQPGVSAQPSQDDLRGEAIMRSLDALEGVKVPAVPIPGSPSRRLQLRRAYTTEPDRSHVQRLSEGDEVTPSNSILGLEGQRPSLIRRVSANGKSYVPKRSASPSTRSIPHSASASVVHSPATSPIPTPTSVSFAFPTGNPGQTQLGSAIRDIRPPMVRMERRQSEILPPKSIYGGFMAQSDRVSSMVNLSSASGVPSSCGYTESNRSSAIRSGPLQVLEFEESGMPAVKYQLGNCIGRGQFGSVYRSLNLGTGQMAAIKRIRLQGMKEDEVRDVIHEVELLKRLTHPSIVKYEGMSRDEEYLNIVLEFVENGSLDQTLKAFGIFNERLVSSYVAKILEGLDYLHSQGVVHCDLKAANILSTKNGNVKLSDFGVSLNMKAVENIKQDAVTRSKAGPGAGPKADVAGTPNWMAPEVISLNGASPASDIWSLGCTIIELLTGRPPYAEITNSMTVLFRIVEDEMPPIPLVSPELEDFLKLCFIKDPTHRPSAAMLFQHPWVSSLDPQLQLLRPQDSVPFLRRVSMNSQSNSAQLFANDGFEKGRSGPSGRISAGERDSLTVPVVDIGAAPGARLSLASSGHGRDGSDEMRAHTFIKTSFGQAIVCRICHTNVKKVGVLCQTCGLISHTACATSTTSRCNPHEQYALYARQQEYLQSSASSRYVSPQTSMDNLQSTKNLAFPGKLLLGIKRSSKAALRSSSSVDLASDVRRRKSSSHSGAVAPMMVDRSLSNPTPDQSSHNSRQSRASMISDVSVGSTLTDEVMEDGRRRSGVRFKLGGGDTGDVARGSRVGLGDAAKSVARGYPQPGEKRVKKDKTDCVLQ